MTEKRLKPEEILARLKEEEAQHGKGRLKIFLGMAAGVGKTYTMLEVGQQLQREGVDVVAGVIVTHGRKETEALLDGLEVIPLRDVEYRGTTIKEFDLDEVLLRKPAVVLVDELAHTNAPGSRHEKRWQDVEELLQAGIDVWTTLNVQHLESVNDLIAQITRVKVRETLPDSIFEKAYEVELVDLPPDDLIQRLEEGKVYVPENAKAALSNFFQKGNLIALRELALRATADRVDAQMLRYKQETHPHETWAVTDRILVCVGPSPLSAKLVRAAKRMAGRLNAEWYAVYVETPNSARLSERDRNRITRTLALAQRLGAQTDRITDSQASDGLVNYARRCNVTKIVIGKPMRPRWRELLFGSVVDDLIRRSGSIDVYVITGDKTPPEDTQREAIRTIIHYDHYAYTIAVVLVATLLSKWAFPHLATVNLAMIYQLAVVLIALRYGKGPSLLAAVLSVAAFDFFFIPPYLSFAVSDTQYLITFFVMFIIATSLSTLTSTVKLQAELARKREKQTSALYRMTREQATTMGVDNIVKTSVKHIADVFECKCAVLITANEQDKLVIVQHDEPTFDVDAKELGVAQWVHLNKQPAGATTSTLSGAQALYMPLIGSAGALGVIGIKPATWDRLHNPDEMHLLETFVNQMALAAERAQLSERRRLRRSLS